MRNIQIVVLSYILIIVVNRSILWHLLCVVVDWLLPIAILDRMFSVIILDWLIDEVVIQAVIKR